MKPLDSNDGAARVARPDDEEGVNERVAPSGFAPSDDAVETPRGPSDSTAALEKRGEAVVSAPARVSCVVPVGTALEERVNDAAESSDSVSMRPSDIVPRSPVPPSPNPHDNRAAARVAELEMTRPGPSFALDEDDEATTVDATAGLSFEEREALIRVHSAMEETLPHGTPPPHPVHVVRSMPGVPTQPVPVAQPMPVAQPVPVAQSMQPVPIASPDHTVQPVPAVQPVQPSQTVPAGGDVEPAPERRNVNIFKQTMLLGLPSRETPAPAAPVDSGAESVVLASALRVVGPPTQPPPRRSRRVAAADAGPSVALSAGPLPGGVEPHSDHEAFSLVHPIASPEPSKRVIPEAALPPSAALPLETARPGDAALPASAAPPSLAASRASLPGVMLPPAPHPRDYEPDASLGSARYAPLRATIEPPSSASRTRPPLARRSVDAPNQELPLSDPFAGFVAPPPSLFQRWLVVVVVALAVVGLCSLAAIALGFLGKTGW